jgi:DNA (cytosine-5)-methyltransferase 1
VLENVTGALTSHGGRDFAHLMASLADAGYRAGALVLDAVRFVPQSRPRIFVIGAHSSLRIPEACVRSQPADPWQPVPLRAAQSRLPARLRKRWMWWNVPIPSAPIASFDSILERDGDVEWQSQDQTEHLMALMSPLHREKLQQAKLASGHGERVVGTIYRRTRHAVQRAEARFDQISGCLRTPAGGSSRQTVIVVEGERVRTRLLSAREAARLMGVPDSYPLPARYNDAYHLFGDGVAVPVAAWLSEHLLLPLALPPATERAA